MGVSGLSRYGEEGSGLSAWPPFFCAAAGGPYARREVVDLIRRLEDIDRTLDGEGAMALPTALERAMGEI